MAFSDNKQDYYKVMDEYSWLLEGTTKKMYNILGLIRILTTYIQYLEPAHHYQTAMFL